MHGLVHGIDEVVSHDRLLAPHVAAHEPVALGLLAEAPMLVEELVQL